MKTVIVLPYTTDWEKAFRLIEALLAAGLRGIQHSIEHVGSTAIPGMVAKPIIDIDVVIDRRDFVETKKRLKEMGYMHEGDLGIKDREAFDLTDPDRRERMPAHNLYVCPQDSEELRRHVAFRDYLRVHPHQRSELSALKQELARAHQGNRDAYQAGKADLVKKILKLALSSSHRKQEGGSRVQRNSDLFNHFMQVKDQINPKLTWEAATAKEHEQWRRKFGAKLKQLAGRLPDTVPLSVHWAEKTQTKAFTRHKIYVQSEEHYWVPAYYFVPNNVIPAARAFPAIVCLHGHSGIYPYIREGSAKERNKGREHELDYAPLLAEHGYVTIAPIQRGWNETGQSVDPKENGCQRMVLNAFLSGQTPVGLRCWDASRLIDFLKTQKTVDPSRIGVAGLSGGGMVALFWAALEPRIKLAMVAGYYCTFKDSIYSIYHCLCNCVPNMLEWGEMREIAALIGPRPLLVISGKQDAIFPIKATRRAYAELRKVYELLDASDKLESDFFDGPHMWSNRKALPFLARHFGKP